MDGEAEEKHCSDKTSSIKGCKGYVVLLPVRLLSQTRVAGVKQNDLSGFLIT
jgi:hypothetical protein